MHNILIFWDAPVGIICVLLLFLINVLLYLYNIYIFFVFFSGYLFMYLFVCLVCWFLFYTHLIFFFTIYLCHCLFVCFCLCPRCDSRPFFFFLNRLTGFYFIRYVLHAVYLLMDFIFNYSFSLFVAMANSCSVSSFQFISI